MPSSVRCLAILLWSVSFFTSTTGDAAVKITANETDSLALLAIKSQLHDPLGFTTSWNNSVDICEWRGVTCGQRHRRVTKLDLRNQSIGGFLSPYVGNLSFLRFINLADNSFYGEIPDEMGRLFRLETLIVATNSFSGEIPTNLSRCSNLVKFYAHSNKLVGEIPAEISYLLKLVKLSIADNHLTGKLPPSIGNLSALQVIYLPGNSLSGRIPDTLGQLRSLNFLNVGENNFCGIVPLSIYNISSLETFSLLSNRLEGNLPLDIGVNLANLEYFIVAQNNLTGSLPHSLSNATKLLELDLGENFFNGRVSNIDFNRLTDLTWLSLGANNLGTGTISDLDFVSSLTNCSKLEWLFLSRNQFGGILPHSVANLSTTLSRINIEFNQIHGTIPPGIGNLVNIDIINFASNHLTGTIPRVVGELKSLTALSLSANKLQGNIPSSLGNITLLNVLLLDSNNLQGNIPSSLGNCQNLMLLNVSQNNLTGTVPQQILGIMTLSIFLGLSDNLLRGSFPSQVGDLKNLVALDISRNEFSGEIPDTLGGCASLEYLNMQRNYFSGSIPHSLSYLRSVKELDLSCNNLSGQIPNYLEDLSFLIHLNLSYNHFEGKVPTKGVFSNTTGISLTGNRKLCGGSDELHLPSCHSRGSRQRTITLLKVLIPVTVSCLILFACFIVVYARRRRSEHKSSIGLPMEQQFPLVSYAELSMATNEFSSSNMIGQGSYGFVYKGILGENNILVAVKVINLKQKGASRSFVAECEALRNIRHRNLIKIITICSSIDSKGADFKALVYQYMQNGSLEEWLHQSNDELGVCSLSLIQRLNIAIDVACAIEYLHHHCQPPIVHGDLKPNNVLLDHDMVGHVGDFGLARFLSDRSRSTAPETQSSSVGIKGTVGYVAPEYGMGSEVSMPGDVYSFGILLLEMFTRRRPTDDMFSNGQTLHGLARMALPEKVTRIVDHSLLFKVSTGNSTSGGDGRVKIGECLAAIVGIGVFCSMETPVERMEMKDVVAKLCAARENFLAV